MAEDSRAESVTLWTSVCFLEQEEKSKAKSEARYYFESLVFYQAKAFEIPGYLRERREAAQKALAPFIVIAKVVGNPQWLHSALDAVFPMMKPRSTREFLDTKKWERGTIMLPTIDKEHNRMSFFMQYPAVKQNDAVDSESPSSGAKVIFRPVAVWLDTHVFTNTSPPVTPDIVMACRDDEVVKTLQEQCVSENWKLEHLLSGQARIFVDLFAMLAQWSDVWGHARRELALREAQLHGNARTVSVLQQTRALHRDTANVIAMREDLRLHITAFQKYRSLVRPTDSRKGLTLFADEDEKDAIEERIEECLQNLRHQQDSSAVIHKQLENLLSLAFNTEMVAQGQAVARLNSLAFAFLPLSYVATLFGMTNFSISSAWYPLGAFIIVVLVLIAFRLTNLITKFYNQSIKRRTARSQHDSKRPTKPAPSPPSLSPFKSQPSQPKPLPISLTTPEGGTQRMSATPPPSSPTSPPQPSLLSRLNPIRYTPWGKKQVLPRLSAFGIPRQGAFPTKVDPPEDMGYLSVGAPHELVSDDGGYRGWGRTRHWGSDEDLFRGVMSPAIHEPAASSRPSLSVYPSLLSGSGERKEISRMEIE